MIVSTINMFGCFIHRINFIFIAQILFKIQIVLPKFVVFMKFLLFYDEILPKYLPFNIFIFFLIFFQIKFGDFLTFLNIASILFEIHGGRVGALSAPQTHERKESPGRTNKVKSWVNA